ncbi:hypothetical protein DLAC_07251 [Tieghemostelium lacteum]|uniref:Uncharacterized protein n=1 Tax=Tieghemostelium lacteum TaxID=361077 RepID=A0A151ZC88_TIELA|nr:hypothetical protein DLAC_07251 [Tieghemostelium lacteum]|eukprot:KYQ91494.1 hypothetical protein DLAC_07251 [Tieghemostelium lacteum]
MWKRKKEIEGVSNSSIITLKSVLANEEREIKQLIDDGIIKPGGNKQLKKTPIQIKSNKGVSDRNEKDLESETSEENQFEKSHKALLEKSKIYHNRVSRDPFDEDYINDSNVGSNDNDDSLIDFREKSYEKFKDQQQQQQQQQHQHQHQQQQIDPDAERESKRRQWENEHLLEQDPDELLDEQKDIIKENKIVEMKKQQAETQQARDKTLREKELQKQQQESRLIQINKQKKLAELRQQLKSKQQQHQQQQQQQQQQKSTTKE